MISMSRDRKADIHARLLAWGEAVAGGVGAPASSGCWLVSVRGTDYGTCDLWSPAVEEMERAVGRLPDDERRVVREMYTVFDATVDQHCRVLAMSSSRMYRLRESAWALLHKTLTEFRYARDAG